MTNSSETSSLVNASATEVEMSGSVQKEKTNS